MNRSWPAVRCDKVAGFGEASRRQLERRQPEPQQGRHRIEARCRPHGWLVYGCVADIAGAVLAVCRRLRGDHGWRGARNPHFSRRTTGLGALASGLELPARHVVDHRWWTASYPCVRGSSASHGSDIPSSTDAFTICRATGHCAVAFLRSFDQRTRRPVSRWRVCFHRCDALDRKPIWKGVRGVGAVDTGGVRALPLRSEPLGPVTVPRLTCSLCF
ncbi:hypothetical protein ABIC83_000827 [Roseateles asaccharophilus]